MSASLSLLGVSASFGARPLFAGLDLTLGPGDVTALVGPNGAGKTTLLRIVAGEHAPDAGVVRLSPADAAVGYLPQSPPRPDETLLDYAGRRTGVTSASDRLQDAAAHLAHDDPAAPDAYAHALEAWLHLGGADLDVRLAETLARVGLDVALDRPLGSLSGGQASRAALATILVSRFDVLALDEPTNNLDADGLAALTGFVRTCGAPLLIATHDRDFVDAVATSVLELDLHQQTVTRFAGGWTDYRAAKALARAQAVAAYDEYAARRDDLAEEARRKAEWARKGRAKASALGPHMQLAKKKQEDGSRRMDQRAARARDAAERLAPVEQPRREWDLRYRIAEAPPSGDVVLTLDAVVATAGAFRVGPVSTQVLRGDRVALVGPNGSGKTTLLAALQASGAASGRLAWGTRVALGSLDQARATIGGDENLADRVRALTGASPADARTLLAKFGLGAEHVGRPCHTLSLGERARAALAVLQQREVNTLILDEPTNHLDVEAIEQLQDALAAFAGTLLLVTHDRALARAIEPTVTWTFARTGDAASVRVER